jgi:hypothetical protein
MLQVADAGETEARQHGVDAPSQRRVGIAAQVVAVLGIQRLEKHADLDRLRFERGLVLSIKPHGAAPPSSGLAASR